MKILIVAATRAELSGLCGYFTLPEEDFIQTAAFDLLITGVGMTATAFALGKYLSESYNLVLNLGIAGCYEWKYPLGSLLNVTHDTFSELGAEDRDEFLTIDALGFGKSSYTAGNEPGTAHFSLLPRVSGITVNKVHGNKSSIKAIEKRLHPVTESMEGAAVFYCCEQLGIPCVQVRAISNYVEERNRELWKIGLAVKNLNEWAIEFLTNR
ncbi:futalosine hydrolase [Pedobacter hartonius]|uniref:Futalosine hydrolase n=1 Tax=Pedobacter hartonius TaxID=425514 RepID=A0A1H4HI08_9SPHI|nr:futalosine hydrolase [Pedobacter hartonius]SEB21285.1 futalosine hydrolase [Pedobacter hartonius]